MLTLDEIKNYLRLDTNEDDELIKSLYNSSLKLCMDIARIENQDKFYEYEGSRVALLYAIAYFYEHREEANYKELTLTLRALLFGIREVDF